MTGNSLVTYMLLRKNANLELEDSNGNTAFIVACEWGNIKIAEILLANGANVAKVNSFNKTGFHYLDRGTALLCKKVRLYNLRSIDTLVLIHTPIHSRCSSCRWILLSF